MKRAHTTNKTRQVCERCGFGHVFNRIFLTKTLELVCDSCILDVGEFEPDIIKATPRADYEGVFRYFQNELVTEPSGNAPQRRYDSKQYKFFQY